MKSADALKNSNAGATTMTNSQNDSQPWERTLSGSKMASENSAREEALAIVDEMVEETRIIRRMIEELQQV